MDAAKGIMVLATNEGPLSKYDDAKGGDKLMDNKTPSFNCDSHDCGNWKRGR